MLEPLDLFDYSLPVVLYISLSKKVLKDYLETTDQDPERSFNIMMDITKKCFLGELYTSLLYRFGGDILSRYELHLVYEDMIDPTLPHIGCSKGDDKDIEAVCKWLHGRTSDRAMKIYYEKIYEMR